MTDYTAFQQLSPTTLADVLTRDRVMDIGIRPLWPGMPRVAGPAYQVDVDCPCANSNHQEVRMHPRYYLALATFLMLLSACGRPEAATRALPTRVRQTGEHSIAARLAVPPAPGQTVEVDAYHWVGWRRSASFESDAQGCPVASAGGILTDWPVPEAIRFPFKGNTNASPGYPPDADPWLIPMPVLTTPSPATPVTSLDSSAPVPTLRPVAAGSVQIPYHARLRGHFGDPAFAQCAHGDRIFVVEGVAAVYDANGPLEQMGLSLQPPADYASWPQYHDADLGYRFAYAPDWSVEPVQEPDALAAVAVRTPQAPDAPLLVRVLAGETHSDPYDDTALSPRIKRQNKADDSGSFDQGFVQAAGGSGGQQLRGLWVERVVDASTHTMAVLISAHGRTYELTVRYPLGLHADQSLLDTYSLLIDRFALDAPPEPSPTPPIKQALGAGPFLSQDEALAAARRKHGSALELLEARLVSEAEMRQIRPQSVCGAFRGHPDGVWMLRVRGVFEGARRTMLWALDAKTGNQLCGDEISLDELLPTSIPETSQPAETRAPGYPGPTAAAP